MKRVLAFSVALSASLCMAQQRTIMLRGPRWITYAPRLQQLLGPGWRVIDSHHLRAARGTKTKTLIILDDYTPPDDRDWPDWADHVDRFVTGTRFSITTGLGIVQKQNYRILLPPGIKSSIYAEDYMPLMKQIARELGVSVIDLSASKDPAKDLFLSLVDIQHNPGNWRVVRATSEQSDEGPAKNAIDDNPNTYWHTRYDPNPTKVPHEIVIDLGKEDSLAGFSYLARQDGGVNGRVKDFEVYVGDDPRHWGAPALRGTLQNSMSEQRRLFEKRATGRYLRFVALSEVNGNIWTSVAELGVIRVGNVK